MKKLLYGVAIVISMLISLWINGHETVINPDAICYLLSAETMNTQGFSAGMHVCSQANWPFYSFLIAELVKFTSLSYTTVAYLLDGFLSLMTVTLFIAIVEQLGGTLRVMWLAAAVILLSHELTGVRQYIVRDHGYWAFYLASFLLLLHHSRRPTWQSAISFSMSLIVATLFRVEGAIFLLLLPLVSWFITTFTWRERAYSFVKLNCLTIVGGVSVVVMLVVTQHGLDKLGRVPYIVNQIQHGLMMSVAKFQAMEVALGQYVLNSEAVREVGLVLFLTMAMLYLVNVAANLTWLYCGLVVYAWWRRVPRFSVSSRLVIIAYLAINIMITTVFLFERLFLSNRYLVGLSLIFMLWVPFALDALWRRRLVMGLIAVWMLVAAFGGVVGFGYSKTYIREAGDWLSTHVAKSQSLYANDFQLMYYSQHYGNDVFKQLPIDLNRIANNQWRHYDYIALRSSKHDDDKTTTIEQAMALSPVVTFSNTRGDTVRIYQISTVEKLP